MRAQRRGDDCRRPRTTTRPPCHPGKPPVPLKAHPPLQFWLHCSPAVPPGSRTARPTTDSTERRRGDQAAAARSISVSPKACGHRAGVCVNGICVQGPGEQAVAHVGEEHAQNTGATGSPPRRGEKVDGEGGGRAHLRSARRRPSPGRSSTAWLAPRTDFESVEQPQRALPVGETLRGEEGRNGRRNQAFLDADGCSACAPCCEDQEDMRIMQGHARIEVCGSPGAKRLKRLPHGWGQSKGVCCPRMAGCSIDLG